MTGRFRANTKVSLPVCSVGGADGEKEPLNHNVPISSLRTQPHSQSTLRSPMEQSSFCCSPAALRSANFRLAGCKSATIPTLVRSLLACSVLITQQGEPGKHLSQFVPSVSPRRHHHRGSPDPAAVSVLNDFFSRCVRNAPPTWTHVRRTPPAYRGPGTIESLIIDQFHSRYVL